MVICVFQIILIVLDIRDILIIMDCLTNIMHFIGFIFMDIILDIVK